MTQTTLPFAAPIQVGDRVAVTYHGQRGFRGTVCFVGTIRDYYGKIQEQIGVRFNSRGPRWSFHPSEVKVLAK